MKTLPLSRCGEKENLSWPLFCSNRRKETAKRESSAREPLESDQNNLRRILDSLDAGAYVTDMETCEILYINRHLRYICGDVEGRICWQVFQKNQDGPCPFCNNGRLVNERGEPERVLLREVKNTRNQRWYECRDSAVSWFDGRIVRLEIFTDITERKRKEEEYARKMKLETLCVLAEDIIHDFNKLLSVSMGYLSLARLNVPPYDPASQFLEKTEEAFMKSGKLAARLFALIGQEGKPFHRRVSPDVLLLDSVRLFLRGSDLKSAFVLAAPLWTVCVDENQIRQVIFHFLQNARQAMPQGGQVTIRAENVFLNAGEKGDLPVGSYVRWSVEDRGIGISSEILPRVFDPGFAAWPDDNREKSGWGLAASRSIVRRHQGLIDCRSEPGVGTTMIVYLPAETVP